MWEQKDKDREFNLNEIDPIVGIVEAYKSKNGSYPTLDGFNLLILGSRFENRITECKSDSNSFHFSIWRGEWNESYSSKGEVYSTGQVHYADHFILTSIALISLVFLLRNKKSANLQHPSETNNK